MHKKFLLLILFAAFFNPEGFAESQLLDRVVAVVNDEVITQSELDMILRPIYEQLRREYEDEELMTKFTEIRRKLLNQMIEDRLVFQEAKKRAIEPEAGEIDRKMEEIKKNFPNEMALEDELKAQGLTVGDLRERLKRESMIRRLHDIEIRAKVMISPTEIEEYYKNHPSEFSSSERVRVRSLTVKKSDETREKGLMDEKAKRRIEDIRQKILKGEDFASLAGEFSEDSHAKDGGLSDWIGPGEMIPAVDQVIFNLKPGEISEMIETPMGYHLFRLEEKQPGSKQTFEEVRDQIYGILFKQKGEERFREWMQELKQGAYISLK